MKKLASFNEKTTKGYISAREMNPERNEQDLKNTSIDKNLLEN